LCPTPTRWNCSANCTPSGVAGAIPDTLLLLEHPPVITLGKAFHPEHLRYAREFYAQQGIELHPTDRGGDVTCHNPGQLVGYPIFDVSQHGRDLHKFLRDIEQAIIDALRANSASKRIARRATRACGSATPKSPRSASR
jgi:lipoyl(octanoyl) transferase